MGSEACFTRTLIANLLMHVILFLAAAIGHSTALLYCSFDTSVAMLGDCAHTCSCDSGVTGSYESEEQLALSSWLGT